MKSIRALHADDEVIKFLNKELIAIANKDDLSKNLTRIEQEWSLLIGKLRSTVKIYLSSKCENQIDLHEFAKLDYPGNRLADYFKEKEIEDILITGEQLANLYKRGYFAPPAEIAPGQYDPKVIKDRTYTKYRVIVSDVLILNRDGSTSVIKVITACAPNLMGTSPEDEKEFIDQVKHALNEEKYEKACEEIANLMALGAKESGIETIKIADFGLGAYIRKLSTEQKNKARNIMYRSFKNAAETHKVKFDWILWNDPRHPDEINNKLKIIQSYQSDYFTINEGDIIEGMAEWANNHPSNPVIAVANNGSDHTICGHFLTLRDVSTTEEKLSKRSFLYAIQTVFNPSLTDNVYVVDTAAKKMIKKEVSPFREIETSKQQGMVKLFESKRPGCDESDKIFFESFLKLEQFADEKLNSALESIPISFSNGNLQVQFANKTQAETFANVLKAKFELSSSSNKAKPKSAIKDKHSECHNLFFPKGEITYLREKVEAQSQINIDTKREEQKTLLSKFNLHSRQGMPSEIGTVTTLQKIDVKFEI